MKHKPYCTNNTQFDCRLCSLNNYGRDCHNNPIADNVHIDARIPRAQLSAIRNLVMARQELTGRFVSQNSILIEVIERGLTSEPVKGGGEK